MQALQVERDAGRLALLTKENSVKAILHYDTASQDARSMEIGLPSFCISLMEENLNCTTYFL